MEFRREDIAKATNNFSKQECVGEGGFGCVYRGHIHGTTVAVKILKKVFSHVLNCYAHILLLLLKWGEDVKCSLSNIYILL